MLGEGLLDHSHDIQPIGEVVRGRVGYDRGHLEKMAIGYILH